MSDVYSEGLDLHRSVPLFDGIGRHSGVEVRGLWPVTAYNEDFFSGKQADMAAIHVYMVSAPDHFLLPYESDKDQGVIFIAMITYKAVINKWICAVLSVGFKSGGGIIRGEIGSAIRIGHPERVQRDFYAVPVLNLNGKGYKNFSTGYLGTIRRERFLCVIRTMYQEQER